MAKGDDIQERFIEFAVNIIKLTAKLSYSPAENMLEISCFAVERLLHPIMLKRVLQKAQKILCIS